MPLMAVAQDFSATITTIGIEDETAYVKAMGEKKYDPDATRATATWNLSIKGAYNIQLVEDKASEFCGETSVTRSYTGCIKKNSTLVASISGSRSGAKTKIEGLRVSINSSPIINSEQPRCVDDSKKQGSASAKMSFKVKADGDYYDDSDLEYLVISFGGTNDGDQKRISHAPTGTGAINVTVKLTIVKGDEGKGFWRQVSTRYQRNEYSSYTYTDASNRKTETHAKSNAGWVEYRMECLEDPSNSSTYHDGSCKDEFLEEKIAYAQPLKYYEPGDVVQTTYRTRTKHSEQACPSTLSRPSMLAYLRTPQGKQVLEYLENTEGKHMFKSLAKAMDTEEPVLWGLWSKKKKLMHYQDITEQATATMPEHEVGDTVLLCFYATNGQQKHNQLVTYTYVWEEGEMPANPTSYSEMVKLMDKILPQDDGDESGPGGWIWIPFVVIGGGGGIGVYKWLRDIIKNKGTKPKDKTLVDQTKKDRRYYENLYDTTDDKGIRNMQKTDQQIAEEDSRLTSTLGDVYKNAHGNAVFLDKAGDVAITVLDKSQVYKPLAKVLKLGKTYIKNLMEDMLDNRGVVESNFRSTVKTLGDWGKDTIPEMSGAKDFTGKVFIKTTIDGVTNILTNPDDIQKAKEDTAKSFLLNMPGSIDFEGFTDIDGNKPIMEGLGEYVNFSVDIATDDNVQDAIGD